MKRKPQKRATVSRACMLVTSQRQLAAAVGRDVSAVNGWIHDERWPFGSSGPWDVAKVRDWAERTLKDQPGGDRAEESAKREVRNAVAGLGPEKKARIALALERLANLKLEREMKMGLYHRVDECERTQIRRIIDMRDAILLLPQALSRLLAGKVAADCEQILRDHLRAVLNAWATRGPSAAATLRALGDVGSWKRGGPRREIK